VVPPAARRLAGADARLAGVLLGPGRAERLEERVRTLTRSRADIIEATDAERRRIERDLHDGLQQRLMSLALNLGMARSTLADGPAREVVAAAHEEAVAAVTELREFVRGLHPAVLNDRGLDAAISGVAARAPIPVRVTVEVEPRCSPTIEAIAYFTVSVRHRPAGRLDPGGRLPTQGPGRAGGRPRGRAAPGGRGRHRAGPGGGRPAAGPAPGRPSGPVDAARARSAAADGRGPVNTGIAVALRVSRSAAAKYVTNVFAKLELTPTAAGCRPSSPS
jgi:hypothetical protein